MSSSKHSSTLFGFVSRLLIILVFNIRALPARDVCFPSSCGDIKDISYPFQLKGDSSSCGDKDYELSCQNNQTILEFNSGKYLVNKIWYHQRKITVVDYNLANGTCNLPYKALSYSKDVLDIRYDIAELDAKTNAQFVRCRGQISNFTYIPLPCLNQNESYAYVRLGGSTILDISDLPKSCWLVSTVPTNVDSLQDMKLQQLGFNLTWSVECKDCRLNRGLCQMEFYPMHCESTGQNYAIELVIIILTAVESFLLRVISTPFAFFLMGPGSYPIRLGEILSVFCLFPSLLFIKFHKILYGNQSPDEPLSFYFQLCITIHSVITKAIFIIAILGFFIHKYIVTRYRIDLVEKFLYNQRSIMPRRYHYAEIMIITRHLSEKLGQGGFGCVYKGQLFDGTLVAVKVFGKSKFNGEEFINEVSTVGNSSFKYSAVIRVLF